LLGSVAESFFAIIRRELIDTRAWPTREGLRRAVFDYIDGWYNVRRLHSLLHRMGSHPPQRRPSGGMINTTNLSVKADQAQTPAKPSSHGGAIRRLIAGARPRTIRE